MTLLLSSRTGISGLLGLILSIIAVVPMWASRLFKSWRYETRHSAHLCVAPMAVAVCWHHPSVMFFLIGVFGYWGLDRAYIVLVKTQRVDNVAFMVRTYAQSP